MHVIEPKVLKFHPNITTHSLQWSICEDKNNASNIGKHYKYQNVIPKYFMATAVPRTVMSHGYDHSNGVVTRPI